MTGTTHLIFGITAASVVALNTELLSQNSWGGVVVVTAAVASITADIDKENSLLSKSCLLMKSVSILIAHFFGHRGILHTPFFLGLLAILSQLVPYFYGMGERAKFIYFPISFIFIFGYATHLFLDLFTPQGIMLLYPFNKDYFSLSKGPEWTAQIDRLIFATSFIIFFVIFITQ